MAYLCVLQMTSISRSQEPWISDEVNSIVLGGKKDDLYLLSQMVEDLCYMKNASLEDLLNLKSMGFL